MSAGEWESHAWHDVELKVLVDVSRAGVSGDIRQALAPKFRDAFAAMAKLEAGAIANPDENRMVGHYWLRNPDLAPGELQEGIRKTVDGVEEFAAMVHEGIITPAGNDAFTHFLLIGIGGSALGPQLVAHALGGPRDKLEPFFIDNTDPDGIDAVLGEIGENLKTTLTIVVSKSGGTKETRNGMLEVKAAYERAGLDFGKHAVAVTGVESVLEAAAKEQGFLAVFPMWDWVGGRTSELSAVGLLPAALQGIDIRDLLKGARDMDERARVADVDKNPAALLAAAWHAAGNGRGDRDMVVLPYKDRLQLFSRYLQQLVMESLGKEVDRDGNAANQGIVVYGNKGSTDQHAYVQQLRDGPDNFFVTFIEVLKDRESGSPEMEDGATSGDYLLGFLLGTRQALIDKGRLSITITLPDVSAHTLGMLIALYERTVGLYAELVNVNAYHQPGVEAGKKAAGEVLALQKRALAALREDGKPWTVAALADHLGAAGQEETLFKILEHAAANPDHGVEVIRGSDPIRNTYRSLPG